MDEILLLRGIRPDWLARCLDSLSKTLGEGAHGEVKEQLELFADLLEHAIESNKLEWLDSVISDWASALTTTDLENRQPTLSMMIDQLSQITYHVCRDRLPDEYSRTLIDALIPCFNYAFIRAAQFEIQSRVSYVTEQLNQMKQTMERLDKTKSDFISVASHELRTPLTLIEGYSAILRENLERETHQSVNSSTQEGNILLLDGIHTGARRLRGIVDDMVDVSMIDNNLLNLNFQPVWINRLFTALRNELRENLKERNQSLEILDFPGSNEMTFGDPERLLQVFRNLVTNAIKYSPDDKKIQVGGRKLPGFIEVLVSDTGIGIAPEDLSRIFEKFFRIGDPSLHSSGKTKFKGGGPGLGLHIARGIIEAHGGAIWAESPGFDEVTCPGSTFHVLLPIRDRPPDIQFGNWYLQSDSTNFRKET